MPKMGCRQKTAVKEQHPISSLVQAMPNHGNHELLTNKLQHFCMPVIYIHLYHALHESIIAVPELNSSCGLLQPWFKLKEVKISLVRKKEQSGVWLLSLMTEAEGGLRITFEDC